MGCARFPRVEEERKDKGDLKTNRSGDFPKVRQFTENVLYLCFFFLVVVGMFKYLDKLLGGLLPSFSLFTAVPYTDYRVYFRATKVCCYKTLDVCTDSHCTTVLTAVRRALAAEQTRDVPDMLY